ncbi:hypothetical protein MUK42_34945 [Musa troglodytarum]|uniref:Uncharacterized protein n=1 Tax=Musa troglodytarum TaxID=320322 RepID=A0A9E7K9Q2_9LILI|nr:hypothetical protein MUK42_34945 [Musa troglodytarum]
MAAFTATTPSSVSLLFLRHAMSGPQTRVFWTPTSPDPPDMVSMSLYSLASRNWE